MKLNLLDVNKFAKGLTPVTSTELKTRAGGFNADGLFSEEIFGVERSTRPLYTQPSTRRRSQR